jgi:hypothetical protein
LFDFNNIYFSFELFSILLILGVVFWYNHDFKIEWRSGIVAHPNGANPSNQAQKNWSGSYVVNGICQYKVVAAFIPFNGAVKIKDLLMKIRLIKIENHLSFFVFIW